MATPSASIPKGYKLVPDDGSDDSGINTRGSNLAGTGYERTVIPEAQGKGEAARTFLARGGPLRDRGKYAGTYRKGPLRGMTPEQAASEFENRWQGANGAVKDKYAARARNSLSPSEKKANGLPQSSTNASLNAARPGETTAQASARHRESRGGGTATTPAMVGEKGSAMAGPPRRLMNPTAGNTGNPVAIGTPEEQARVAAMLNEGEGYATAGRGNDSADAAAVAMAKKAAAEQEAAATAKRAAEIKTASTQPRTGSSTAPTTGSTAPAAPAVNPTAPPVTRVSPATRPPTAAEGNKSPEFLASNAAYGKIADERMAPGGPADVKPALGSRPNRPNRPADDFTPGEGKEQAGVVNGRPTYAPKVAAVTATPQQRAGAQRSMERDGIVPMSRTATTLPPRGPASQPVATGPAAVMQPARKDDPDIIRKDNVAAANYQSSFSGGNPSDAEFNAAKNGQKALYDGATEMDKARLVGNSLKRSSELNRTATQPVPVRQPVSSRVIASRPATPEESRTGVVAAPRPMLARR